MSSGLKNIYSFCVLFFLLNYVGTKTINTSKHDVKTAHGDLDKQNVGTNLATLKNTIVKIPPYKNYVNQKAKPRYKIKKKYRKKQKISRIKRIIHGRYPKWSHHVWLGEQSNSPRFSWNPKHNYVEFKVVANTIGSIELVFDGKDVIELWVNDATGAVYFKDKHFNNNTSKPVEDAEDSYTIIDGKQNLTHTEVAFKRRWDTCDDEDALLGADTVRISWSIHPHDPDEGNMSDNISVEEWNNVGVVRGTKSLLLLVPAQPELSRHGLHHWDVLMKNVLVPDSMTTHYWCKIFRSPYFGKKHHIIGYEPMILSNITNFVHHMLLYECNVPPGYLDVYSGMENNGTSCYSSDMPKDWATCVTPVATWVIGGDIKVFPKHIGVPIGPGQSYYMLEVHYDNLGLKKVVDNSGFRLYYTDQLRPNDAGVLMTGVTVSPLHIIPPGQTLYRTTGLCNNACTQKVLPDNGINLVSVLLHSHMAGRGMRLRHIRGDREMSVIVQDQGYDYNYQVDRMLNDEVVFFPGDQLITECDYSTVDRNNLTWGGYSTREEMCLSFVLYYPRTKLAACQSMTPVSYFFETLGIKSFYNFNMEQVKDYILRTAPIPKMKQTTTSPSPPTFSGSDEDAIAKLKSMPSYIIEDGADDEENFLLRLEIKEPAEFRNRSLIGHLSALPWNDMLLTKPVGDGLNRGLQMVFCRLSDDRLAVPLNEVSYPNFTSYKSSIQSECTAPSSYQHSSAKSHHLQVLPVISVCYLLFTM